MKKFFLLASLFAALCFGFVSCNSSQESAEGESTEQSEGEEHEHAEGEDHEHTEEAPESQEGSESNQ